MPHNQSEGSMYDYLYSKYLLEEDFGIALNEDDFVEKSWPIYRNIGNISTATHVFDTVIPDDLILLLPCNCDQIDSVSTFSNREGINNDLLIIQTDYSGISMTTAEYNFMPDIIDNLSLKRHNLSRTSMHPTGEFVSYTVENLNGSKILKFDDKHKGVHIEVIYKGILMDNENNPLITLKTAQAISYKMAFMYTQKLAFKGDPTAMKMLPYIKQESNVKMAAAGIPEYLTQNFFDQLLKAKTRHDRKVFNSSYKTLN